MSDSQKILTLLDVRCTRKAMINIGLYSICCTKDLCLWALSALLPQQMHMQTQPLQFHCNIYTI